MNPMTAISVDDDAVSSMVIKRVASSIGLNLELFSDTFAVWNCTEKQRVDIAFVDYMMHGKDGITLIRHIRQHNPNAAIIMITSHRDEGEVKIHALEAGN